MPIRPSQLLDEVKLAVMDAAQETTRRKLTVLRDRAPCRAGCSACCSRMVYVSLAEALIMQDHLVREGSWPIVKKAAQELIPMLPDAQPATWFQMNQACPVLDRKTRLCRAYAVRPTPCSAHFVTSRPEICDPWSTESGGYSPVDFEDVHQSFIEKLEKEIDPRGIFSVRLPIPSALLLAEKVQSLQASTEEELTTFIRNELA